MRQKHQVSLPSHSVVYLKHTNLGDILKVTISKDSVIRIGCTPIASLHLVGNYILIKPNLLPSWSLIMQDMRSF